MTDKHTALAQATTNITRGSRVDVQCKCSDLWSMAQEFAYLRLCNDTGTDTPRLIGYYSARARRIAATYARFYFEMEEHGYPKKKGRYYWMALGAFASKTVACTFEHWTVSSAVAQEVRDYLGKGNFWLFMDVAAWHWTYSGYPDSFELCRDCRNTQACVAPVQEQLVKLPWFSDIGKINNLQVTDEIKEGFALVGVIEDTQERKKRRKAQFDHLMAIAKHEQGNILQKLIYDDEKFDEWCRAQRGEQWWAFAFPWVSPKMQLAFVAACDTDDPELKSDAPKDMKVEAFNSRMDWIKKTAYQFHSLMGTKATVIEQELSTIAGWVGQRDSVLYPNEKRAR